MDNPHPAPTTACTASRSLGPLSISRTCPNAARARAPLAANHTAAVTRVRLAASALLVRYVTDAAGLRCDHVGGMVWQREGGLVEVVDGPLTLPAPGCLARLA